MKIEEVSNLLGFNSINLFVQVFKRHYFYVPQNANLSKKNKPLFKNTYNELNLCKTSPKSFP